VRAFESDNKVATTFGLNAVLLLGAVAIFHGCRRSNGALARIYEGRQHTQAYRDINELPQPNIKRSLFPCGSWPLGLGPELQKVIGLDGVVVVRFGTMCFNFCLLYSPIALCLCFSYASGEVGNKGLAALNISNQDDPIFVWVAIGAAYFITAILVFMLKVEYANFSVMRKAYYRNGFVVGEAAPTEEATPFQGEIDSKQAAAIVGRTVMVERISTKYIHSDYELRSAFEEMFGQGTVERAVLCRNTSALRQALARHQKLESRVQADARRKEAAEANEGGSCSPQLVSKLWQALEGHSIFSTSSKTPQELLAEVARLYAEACKKPNTSRRSMCMRKRSLTSPEKTTAEIRRTTWNALVRASRLVFVDSPDDCTVGFVTFRSVHTQTIAVQVLLQQRSFGMVAKAAPHPKDIIWMNLTVPDYQKRARAFVSFVAMVLVLFFWSVIAALIQALANWNSIRSLVNEYLPLVDVLVSKFLSMLPYWTFWGVALDGFLTGYLPVLAWLLCVAILPHFFRCSLLYYEGCKRWSSLMEYSFGRYHLFQLVTIYISVLSGSFLSKNSDLIQITTGVLRETAAKMDSVSGYFVCLILTKLGVRGANYLLRPGPVLEWCWRYFEAARRCPSKAPEQGGSPAADPLLRGTTSFGSAPDGGSSPLGGYCGEKLLGEGPFIERVLTDLALTLCLCLMYGVISPVVVFAGAAYFGVTTAVTRYNYLFAYVQECDSGGGVFFTLFNRMYIVLVLSLLMLQSYLLAAYRGDNGELSWVLRGAIPVLILFVVWFWYTNHKWYKPICKNVAVEVAVKLRESPHAMSAPISDAGWSAFFRDPVIAEARALLESHERGAGGAWQPRWQWWP